jgi:outer membrane protein assembly factor BamB
MQLQNTDLQLQRKYYRERERYSAAGEAVKSFAIGPRQSVGSIDITPKGTILVAGWSPITEYDLDGKVLAQTEMPGFTSATRLQNGHTLVASDTRTLSVVELDGTGQVVWQYQTPGFGPYRARRR